MRIKEVKLKNFKRFTDLTISDIPEQAKLVLMIGSNGSGKSSLFDAFDWIGKAHKIEQTSGYDTGKSFYYKKVSGKQAAAEVILHNGEMIKRADDLYISSGMLHKNFIGRSSIRVVPKISNSANLEQVPNDADSPVNYTEFDTRFINDVFLYIQQINNALREPVFSGKQADTLKIFKDFIEPLNTSLLNIFGGDELTTIQIAEFHDASPREPAKLIFRKGDSKINYDLLSHGEKQVVILLINFIVRREYYEDSIIFIDEMDCHLNTSLQYSLLNEIVDKWVPDSAQLWTATHALGFIDYARKSDAACIVDFDLLNFDTSVQIVPESKDNLEVYEIAIPKSTISRILQGYRLVVVENKNDEHFNAALGASGYLFLPANNNREVFLTIKGDREKLGLRDRDYLRDDEIRAIQSEMPGFKILKYSNFENYIYHPDNIAELNWEGFNREAYVQEVVAQKNAKLIEIVSEIGTSRTHYIEFKDCIKNDQNLKPITDALKSDDFITFYPFFNMKKHFDKKFLTQFKYTVTDLSSTQWFRESIKSILEN